MIITLEATNQETINLLSGMALLLKYDSNLNFYPCEPDCFIYAYSKIPFKLSEEDAALLTSWEWCIHFNSVQSQFEYIFGTN